MDANRFDTISKLFANRRSRRAAIGGGLGLAAAAAGSRALAQDATPPAGTPEPLPDDPHPDAGTQSDDFLFTQAFESGTWAPKDDGSNVYTLTLTGVPAQVIYFADRPQRQFGTWAMDQFIASLNSEPTDPPNAALVTEGSGEDREDTLIVELINPQYDASSATLTYDATVLGDYRQAGLASAAIDQQDYDFPASFDQGGLFIDGLCDSVRIDCYHNSDNSYVGQTGWVGTCYNIHDLHCDPCHHERYDCGHAFPDQCGKDSSGDWTCHGD